MLKALLVSMVLVMAFGRAFAHTNLDTKVVAVNKAKLDDPGQDPGQDPYQDPGPTPEPQDPGQDPYQDPGQDDPGQEFDM